MIQYSIHENIFVFCKNFNLETENIKKKKNQPLSPWYLLRQRKKMSAMVSQFIRRWMEIKFGYEGFIK